MKREFIQYADACDEIDDPPVSDEALIQDIACVYLSPGQLFACWCWAVWLRIRLRRWWKGPR